MKRRGSITVFLCLMLIVMLGFVGACLEYSRAQAISSEAQMAADSAAESIFAGFEAPLLQQYQLLGRLIPGGDYDGLEKETLRYVDACGGRKKSGDKGSLLAYQGKEADWNRLAFLTDQNGNVFTHMAAESMGTLGTAISMARWLKRLGLSGGSSGKALQDNAGKEEVKASDLLSGYDSWEGKIEEAGSKASESEKTAREKLQKKEEELRAAGTLTPEQEKALEEEKKALAQKQKEAKADRGKGTKYLELIETAKKMLSEGPIRLVLPKDRTLSSGEIRDSDLPSGLSSSAKGRSVGPTVSGGSSLIVHEYLMNSMDCFTSNADKTVAYELEYIIAGKKSDKANLTAVVNRILMMRIAMNLMYLESCPAKMTQAMEAATLAVGWTGQIPLIDVTKQLLLAAWAMAESVVDVRTLLRGERIPLLKDDSSWSLALENIAKAAADDMAAKTVDQKDTDKGLSYEDYLRICLYTSSMTKEAYRAMDVIQWNIRKLDSAFTMADCMVYGELKVTVQTSPIFASLTPAARKLGTLTYKKESTFSYIGY